MAAAAGGLEARLAASFQRFTEAAGAGVAGLGAAPDPGRAGAVRVVIRRSHKDVAGAGGKGAPGTRAALQPWVADLATGQWAPGGPPQALDGSVTWSVPSPSGRFVAVLRKDGEAGKGIGANSAGTTARSVAELWDAHGGALLRSATADGLHGTVLAEDWFGGVAWAPDERVFAYVAEAPAPSGEAKSLYVGIQPGAKADKGQEERGEATAAEQPPGSAHDWEAGGREDWGEKYVGVRLPRLFVVDWGRGLVLPVPGTAEGLSVGQPSFAPIGPDGRRWLAYTGWPSGERRLGMIYCYNRACAVYATDVAGLLREAEAPSAAHVCLTTGSPVSRSPRFSPDGRFLALLAMGGSALYTHNGSSSLRVLDWASWLGAEAGGATPACVVAVETVEDPWAASGAEPLRSQPFEAVPGGAARGSWFPGLYCHALAPSCWAPDGSALFLTSLKGSRSVVLRVEVPSGRVEEEAAARLVLQPRPNGGGYGGPDEDVSASFSAVVPLPAPSAGTGPAARGYALLVSASCPAMPEQVGLLLPDGEAGGWKAAPCPPAVSEGSLAAALFAEAPHSGCRAGRPAAEDPSSGAVAGAAFRLLPPARLDCADYNREAVAADLAGLRWRVLPTAPHPDVAGASVAAAGSGVRACASTAFPFESILVWSQAAVDSAGAATPAAAGGATSGLPLLVFPHGGPHATYATSWSSPLAWLAARGHAVLLVNFRGSLGFGEASTASLPGRAGSADVSDCMQAALLALALGGWTPAAAEGLLAPANAEALKEGRLRPLPFRLDGERVAVAGGSHGGFLSAHLVSQPQTRWLFRAACIRNPVTDVATMAASTDIVDWCWVETAGVGGYPAPSPAPATNAWKTPSGRVPTLDGAALAKMWSASPVAHAGHLRVGGGRSGAAWGGGGPAPDAAAATAVLLMLGLADRRVPPSQGMEWYHLLRAQEAEREEFERAGADGDAEGAAAGWRTRLKLLTFPEDVHALDRPATDGEVWVHTASWLAQHV